MLSARTYSLIGLEVYLISEEAQWVEITCQCRRHKRCRFDPLVGKILDGQQPQYFLQRVGHNWATKHSQTRGSYQSKFNQRNRISRRYTEIYYKGLAYTDWWIKFSGQAIRMIRVKRLRHKLKLLSTGQSLLLAAAVLILGAFTDWIRHIRLWNYSILNVQLIRPVITTSTFTATAM